MSLKNNLKIKKSFNHLLSEKATDIGGVLSQTITKTDDYIDGAFMKSDSLLLCDSQPLYDIPKYISIYLRDNPVRNNFYTSVYGDPLLVKVLKVNAENQRIHFKNDNNIMVAAGASNAFSALCYALCDEGDVILTLSPSYILFADCVKACGAELVLVPCEYVDNRLQVSPNTLEDVIQEIKSQNRSIKGILIINPTNVEGQIWTENEISNIAPIISKHNLLVIEDRVYDGLHYDLSDRQPAYFSDNPLLSNSCVTIDSVSKRFGAVQWRVGWAYGPKDIISAARAYVMNSVWSMTTLFQRASAMMIASSLPMSAFNGKQEVKVLEDFSRDNRDGYIQYSTSLKAGYKKRRDLSILIINGADNYSKIEQNHFTLTPKDELISEYQSYFEKHNLALDGIEGFSTPIIPKVAMFLAIHADDKVFDTLPSYLEDPDQMLHRLIYLDTKVVLLPPSEITLPNGVNFYRMEYGVSEDILFQSLSALQNFMHKWFSYTSEKRNSLVADAYQSLPEKYKQRIAA